MNIFSAFSNLNQILEASPDIWELAWEPVRMFIAIEGEDEGVFLDSERKIISLPVSIRNQPAAVNIIFEDKAFDLALKESVPLSLLYEHQKIRAFGDAKTIFHASIFLSQLLAIVNDENSSGELGIDSHHIH